MGVNMIVPITEFRNKAKSILDSLKSQPVVITQRGRPQAVLESYERYQEREERLAHLETERDEFLLRQAMAEAEEFVSVNELFERYETETGYRLDDFDDKTKTS
jgi:prevent-host-death family protein